MLKKLSLNLLLFFLLSLVSPLTAVAVKKDPLKWSGNLYKVIHNYTAVHKKFFKKSCSPGDEQKYLRLLKNYRGQGYYLPKIKNDIDRAAIQKNFFHYKKKITFINQKIKKLKKNKEFPSFEHITGPLNESIKRLLSFKKKDHQLVTKKSRLINLKESNKELVIFKKLFKTFLNQIYFLKSYNFPNDYLKYREKYEYYKYGKKKDLKRANETFFFRRIVEDGAMDSNHTRSDKYLRTTLDTLYLNIKKEKGLISEVVRYDLNWVLRGVKKILKRGREIQLKRLVEWRERTQETFSFYKELLMSKNKKKALFLIKKENEASRELKEFTYKKQADVYKYWAKQTVLNRALFSLETILVNEVGTLDGKDALERDAVAKVVFNRYYDSFYSRLEPEQEITKYLALNERGDKWLNVLFKVGEFSFTYHYISAAAKIFCPDMSRRGRGVRKKNLKISLKAAKNYDDSFKAFRYFSRISMLGKIDMSSVWFDYQKIPEMIGHLATHQRRLLRNYLADKYDYLYSFYDYKGTEFDVVTIGKRNYSMRLVRGKPTFFDYRNPHLFTYFSKK